MRPPPDIFPFSDTRQDFPAGTLHWTQARRRTLAETLGGETEVAAWKTQNRIPQRGIGDSFIYRLISDQIRARLIRTIEFTNPLLNQDFLILSEEEDFSSGIGARLCIGSYAGCDGVSLGAANAEIWKKKDGALW